MTTIKYVVIHALVKEQHGPIQPSKLGSNVLSVEDTAVASLLDGIVGVYGARNNSAHYGTFRSGEGRGPFPDQFRSYVSAENPSADQFMRLTLETMDQLYSKAENSPSASGGYLVFADYSNEQGRFFMVSMIKQKSGLIVNSRLQPEELMQLDLSRLYQAARINFSKLSDYDQAEENERKDINYLSFISPSASITASGYFITALGCQAGGAPSRATNTLIQESKRLFREDARLRPNRENFVRDLYEYLEYKESSGESVRLSEIDQLVLAHVPAELGDEARELVDCFISRLNSEDCEVPTEFPVSRTALNKHTHISGEGNNWKLTFDRGALGDSSAASVFYDRESDSITISPIPAEMKEKILQELSDRD